MSATDFQIIPLHTIGRTILSLRPHDHDHHHAAEEAAEELEAFQKQVSDQFTALSPSSSVEILSLPWLQSLLDAFILCEEEFRILLLNNKSCLARPPMERVISDFYERSVRALDICNAIRDGIEQIRQWQRLLEIVFSALDSDNTRRKTNQRCLGEGQVRRAKRALLDLAVGMFEEKGSSMSFLRNRSFEKTSTSRDAKSLRKSLSWTMSRGWSASRQIQAIGNNLSAPKSNEMNTTHGLAAAVYTMNCLLFLVMWSLVAAIPCQDRGLQSHLSISRQFVWGTPMLSIHDKIIEESKKRDRKNACSLLKEIYAIEKWVKQMNQLLDSLEFPVVGEKEAEVRSKIQEVQEVYESLKEGLEPLERQVRQTFHMIIRSRIMGFHCFGRSNSSKHRRAADLQGLEM